MRIITDSDEFNDALISLAKDMPRRVDIASYSVYAGILGDGRNTHSWGGKYFNAIQKFLNLCAVADDVRLLIGKPYDKECVKNCVHCQKKAADIKQRLTNHVNHWPNYEWRLADDTHLKLIHFGYANHDVTIVGGRNLTASSFEDMSFVIDGYPDEIRNNFERVWNRAQVL